MVLEKFIEKHRQESKWENASRLSMLEKHLQGKVKLTSNDLRNIVSKLILVYPNSLKLNMKPKMEKNELTQATIEYGELKQALKLVTRHLALDKAPAKHREAALLVKKQLETPGGLPKTDFEKFIKIYGKTEAEAKLEAYYNDLLNKLEKNKRQLYRIRVKSRNERRKVIAGITADHTNNASHIVLGHAEILKEKFTRQ